jgi:hypothetical protein
MPRIRSIHPDACDSDKLSRLSDSAERTFFRLLTHTDDEGRGEDRPNLLASKLYPISDDKTADTIDSDLDELQAVGLLARYRVNGKRYYAIPTFGDWQKPRHPTASKLPPPDDADPEPDDTTTDERRNGTAKRRKAPAGVGGGVGEGEQNLAPAKPPPKKRQREPDPIWDAVIEHCGYDPAALTSSSRGAINKAVADLKAVGATPALVQSKAKAYVKAFPTSALTAPALAKHWPQLEAGKPAAGRVCKQCDRDLDNPSHDELCDIFAGKEVV